MEKAWTFDSIEVGSELSPHHYVLTPEYVRAYTASIGETDPCFCDEEFAGREYGGLLVPPLAVAPYGVLNALWPRKFPIGTLQAGHEYEFFCPVVAGQPLVVRGRVAEKTLKGSRKFVTLETVVQNLAGENLVHFRTTNVLP